MLEFVPVKLKLLTQILAVNLEHEAIHSHPKVFYAPGIRINDARNDPTARLNVALLPFLLNPCSLIELLLFPTLLQILPVEPFLLDLPVVLLEPVVLLVCCSSLLYP